MNVPKKYTLALADCSLISCVTNVSGLTIMITGLLVDCVIQHTKPGWFGTSVHCTNGWVEFLLPLLVITTNYHKVILSMYEKQKTLNGQNILRKIQIAIF